MRAMRRENDSRRGSTLIPVTILLGTMTVLALVFLRVGQRMSQEQGAGFETSRAALLAEAGIAEAIESLREGQSGAIGTAELPAYLGGGVVWVEATDLGGGRTQLDAMAMKESGRAALRVVVQSDAGGAPGASGGSNGFPTMLFANQHLQIDQDIVIDSYDSTLGTYESQATNLLGTTAYAGSAGGASGNSTIQLDAGVKVFGDVSAGPGSTATLAATTYVSGSTASKSQKIPLAPVSVPVIAPSGAYSVANNATKTLNPGTYAFTSVTQGKFSKLKVMGPSTIVMGGYTAGASATLELDCSNGPITVYDTGIWSVDKSYVVGPAPGTALDAAFLISSTDVVQFDQGSKIQVGFYVPNGQIVVEQGAEVWGALVADQIDVKQGTRFHFDENLRDFELPWEIPSEEAADPTFTAIAWSKIEFPVAAWRADRRDPLTLLGLARSELPPPIKAWQPLEQKGDQ